MHTDQRHTVQRWYENKTADMKVVRAYAALTERIKNESEPGVYLYLLDYPISHHHTLAYFQRVKPTPTAVEGVDAATVLTPTTLDDVDKIHLPIFDGMQLLYSSQEKAKLFGSIDNTAEGTEEDDTEEDGTEEGGNVVGEGKEEETEEEGNVVGEGKEEEGNVEGE